MVDKERELNELKKKYSHLQDIYTIVKNNYCNKISLEISLLNYKKRMNFLKYKIEH
jgi:2-oxoglutarate dehydrogenase complex dehydrogenase (E1) component-like enzyme